MNKISRIFISLIIIFSGMSFTLLLTHLFPNTGLARVVLLPFFSILSIISGILSYKWMRSKNNLIFPIIILIILLFIELFLHPYDDNKYTAVKQIINSVKVIRKYPDKIKYEHIASWDRQFRTAAIIKYQNDLPDTMIVFNYGLHKKFIIEYKNGIEKAYNDEVKLIRKDNKIIKVIFYPNSDSQRFEHDYSNDGYGEMKLNSGFTYNDEIISCFMKEPKLYTGYDKLFGRLLKLLN